MPVHSQTINDNRVILHKWTKPVRFEDVTTAFNAAGQLYEQSTLPVHTVFIHLEATTLPPNAISLVLRHPYSPLSHPHSGLLIIVATDFFLRSMAQVLVRIRPDRVVLVSTVDAALAHINRILASETNPAVKR